jgi:hypothetical protein
MQKNAQKTKVTLSPSHVHEIDKKNYRNQWRRLINE